MTRTRQDERYSTVGIALRWSVALLVIANLAIGIGHDAVPPLQLSMGAHEAIGITMLAMTAARVACRLAHRPPALPVSTSGWEKGLAHAVHGLLYPSMIAMPLTGWLMVSGAGPQRPMTWFGLFTIPTLPVGGGLFAWVTTGMECSAGRWRCSSCCISRRRCATT